MPVVTCNAREPSASAMVAMDIDNDPTTLDNTNLSTTLDNKHHPPTADTTQESPKRPRSASPVPTQGSQIRAPRKHTPTKIAKKHQKSADAQNPLLNTKAWLDPTVATKVQKDADGSPKNLGQDEGLWMQCFDICAAGFKCCVRTSVKLSTKNRCSTCGWCLHAQCGVTFKPTRQQVKDVIYAPTPTFTSVCLLCIDSQGLKITKPGTEQEHVSTGYEAARTRIRTDWDKIKLGNYPKPKNLTPNSDKAFFDNLPTWTKPKNKTKQAKAASPSTPKKPAPAPKPQAGRQCLAKTLATEEADDDNDAVVGNADDDNATVIVGTDLDDAQPMEVSAPPRQTHHWTPLPQSTTQSLCL
jgi:hypothetical protein